jgi:hypothetical protein
MCLNEICSKVQKVKYMFCAFLYQNGLKQGDASRAFLLDFALGYAIRKFQENKEEMELNGTNRRLV